MRIWAILAVVWVIFLASNLTGCATARRDVVNSRIQQLQIKVNSLEREVQLKDNRIRYLESELTEVKKTKPAEIVTVNKPMASKPTEKVGISDPNPKQIQTALKKAGFYSGSVDGKIGKNTTKAIKEFQKTNGLIVDGVVGQQTWLKLKKYLD